MSDSARLRLRSSRPSSQRSSSSTSSQRAPQIHGVMISLRTHTETNQPKTRGTQQVTPSKRTSKPVDNITASPVRPFSKAAATCLMQPFAVLSQSWYTNSNEPEEAVPQWVLDGARIADDSPRSSFDSLESREELLVDDSSGGPINGNAAIPIVCKATLASWRLANRPPRWIYEASPKVS